MLRHVILVAVAVTPALLGCAVAPGSDPGSEPASQTSEAVGGSVNNGCGSDAWSNLQIQSVSASPDGHVQVRLCVPSEGSYFNILDKPLVGFWSQYQNRSGTLDLWNIESGAYHSFQAEACFGGNTCWPWTRPAFVYNPFPWTTWTDTDQVTGPAPYDSGFQAGFESLPGGGTRKLVSCAVMFQGTTQVGKGFRDVPGDCYFGWGGGEAEVHGSMVLQNPNNNLTFQQWRPGSNTMGTKPIAAGSENANQEFICRAPFRNPNTGLVDTVPGKTVGNNCNISWGGTEFSFDHNTTFVEVLNEF